MTWVLAGGSSCYGVAVFFGTIERDGGTPLIEVTIVEFSKQQLVAASFPS